MSLNSMGSGPYVVLCKSHMKYFKGTSISSRKVAELANIHSPYIMFVLGLWLVVIMGFGPTWDLIPGDLIDSRFNNYILEHFFRWISEPTQNYWTAPFFFPFKNTTAFSDSLTGSALFYAFFRSIGLDRETSFQWWYLVGFILNYAASSYVLTKYKFKPLAVGFGAFFFAFGLPIMAQESHPQLVYRFCIPLACFALLDMYANPKLFKSTGVLFWLVWQFYLSIYLGVFLTWLLVLLGLLMPYRKSSPSIIEQLTEWPRCLFKAWTTAKPFERTITTIMVILIGIFGAILIKPYFEVSRAYSFHRTWNEVEIMLPRPQSFFLADNSFLWGSISRSISDVPYRWEHQLFPGMAVVILIIIAVGCRLPSENSKIAWLYFSAFVILSVFTININGYSGYASIWLLPGMNSLRAITRVQLVLMWPLAFFTSWTINGMINRAEKDVKLFAPATFVLTSLLVFESMTYGHMVYSKTESQDRIKTLLQQITKATPETLKTPILFVSYRDQTHFKVYEVDAMLASQELNWATLNGYSGNYPPGYQHATSCIEIRNRILNYAKFMKMSKSEQTVFYLDTMQSIVPIGFQDCDLGWWEKPPG